MVRCTRRKGAIWQRQRQQDGVKKKKGTRSYYECADKFTWVHIHVSTDLNPITPKWNSMLETQLSNLSLKTENKATKIEGKEERSKIWNEGELRTWTESELKKGLATLSVINKQKHCKQKKPELLKSIYGYVERKFEGNEQNSLKYRVSVRRHLTIRLHWQPQWSTWMKSSILQKRSEI